MSHSDILNFFQELSLLREDNEATRSLVSSSVFFDDSILNYKERASSIWGMVADDYAKIEESYNFPYRLSEKIHIYAMDSLVICDELGVAEKDAVIASKLYIVLFLLCSYFDDNVEDPDKFYSKFAFAEATNKKTQEGAVAFSTVSVFYELSLQYLTEANVSAEKQVAFLRAMNNSILVYTPFLTSEKDVNSTADAVLEMKQHNVAGYLVAMLADVLSALGLTSENQTAGLRKGLYYLGSQMQMTDDIRDAKGDLARQNANLLNTCISQYGENGVKEFVDIFDVELAKAQDGFADAGLAKNHKILSLPFYPFCI